MSGAETTMPTCRNKPVSAVTLFCSVTRPRVQYFTINFLLISTIVRLDHSISVRSLVNVLPVLRDPSLFSLLYSTYILITVATRLSHWQGLVLARAGHLIGSAGIGKNLPSLTRDNFTRLAPS
jgi:hypothetical protein